MFDLNETGKRTYLALQKFGFGRRSGLAFENSFYSRMKQRPMDSKDLLEAINQVTPYGQYKGRQLLDLPKPYLFCLLLNHPTQERMAVTGRL